MAEAPDRFCGNCGHELSTEDKFCRNCGTPAHVAAKVPTPEADAPVPPPPAGASEVASVPEATVLQKWKPVMWGLVGVVILGAVDRDGGMRPGVWIAEAHCAWGMGFRPSIHPTSE